MAKQEEFKKQLETFSQEIVNYIKKAENQEEKLVLIDNLLEELRNNIRFTRLRSVQHVHNADDNSTSWQDGMLIINAETDILKNTGFQNHLLNSLNNKQKFKFIDFIEKEDQKDFKNALKQAIAQRKNTSVDVLIKTGIVNLNKCHIQFDALSSNLENDRIILYYTFTDHFNMQTFDFQSFVFDNLPGMDLYLFDKEYRYILVGGKEKKRNNFSNHEFVGKKLFDIVDKKTQRKFFPFYNKAVNGEYTEGEVRYKNDIYYLFAAPIKNYKNETIAGIIISQNVTKDKLLEASLIKNKEQAQKSNMAKSIFLANMSHEIRTPLNSILGFTEQLNKTKLTIAQQDLVRLISSASDHLLYLVNEIVFLFKLGMDKVYVESISFSLHDLLDEINRIYSKQAQEKNLKFIFAIDSDVPANVKGDPFRLRQVLMNLLVNALKYTKKGYVELNCKLVSKVGENAEISFEVSDSGIGISKKDLPFIFDVFEQGNLRTEMIRGGAGLGLGISKRLVELLNGKIEVESKLRKGSSFTIQIPFETTTLLKPKENLHKYVVSDQLLAGKKILLADDDDHNLMLAEMILKGWRTDFVLAKDGKEALAVLNNQRFDLVLLDINMPFKTGVQVIKNIRSNPQGINQATPMIALTANAIKTDSVKYMKAGFNSYIIKPIKEAELYSKLCNILKIETPQIKSINTVSSENKAVITDLFDVRELENAAKGDDDFFNKMIDNFINNGNQLLEEIVLELEKENWEIIGQKAHKAITAFKFFKLNNIAEQLMELEDLSLRDKNYALIPDIFSFLKIQIENALEQAKLSLK